MIAHGAAPHHRLTPLQMNNLKLVRARLEERLNVEDDALTQALGKAERATGLSIHHHTYPSLTFLLQASAASTSSCSQSPSSSSCSSTSPAWSSWSSLLGSRSVHIFVVCTTRDLMFCIAVPCLPLSEGHREQPEER